MPIKTPPVTNGTCTVQAAPECTKASYNSIPKKGIKPKANMTNQRFIAFRPNALSIPIKTNATGNLCSTKPKKEGEIQLVNSGNMHMTMVMAVVVAMMI